MAFAAALVLVLALMALFVYLRVGTVLNSTIDDGLQSRAGDLAALVSGSGPPRLGDGRLFGGDEGFSQVLDSRRHRARLHAAPGRGLGADPRGGPCRRRAAQISPDDRKVPGVDGETRILARPVDSGDREVVVVVGATTEDRAETLAGLAGAFLIGAPIALALSCALGYLLAGRALRSGRADAAAGRRRSPWRAAASGSPSPAPTTRSASSARR